MNPLPLADDPELAEAAAAKFADVMERGPHLTKHATIYLVAKCPTGKHELHGGLGGMGVGQMWGPARPEHRDDPAIWDKLPVQVCSNFGIDDACPRPPMTPQEMARMVIVDCDSVTRSGGNVPRWLLLAENADGVIEAWGRNDDVPRDERLRWFAELANRYPVAT